MHVQVKNKWRWGRRLVDIPKVLTHDVLIATIYSFPKLSTVEAVDMIRKSGREWLQSGVRLPKIIHPLVSLINIQVVSSYTDHHPIF